jgi:phage FluMu protein Com
MKRLNETDYDVLELLQANPEGLKFGEILERTGKEVMKTHKSLTKLLQRNYASKEDIAYKILETNEKATILRVQCPVCKTIKRIHNDTQESTVCKNPECKNKGGWRREYWIISPYFQEKGITKRINLAEC